MFVVYGLLLQAFTRFPLSQRIRGAEQVEDPALTAKHREWETYGKACEIAMEEILVSYHGN